MYSLLPNSPIAVWLPDRRDSNPRRSRSDRRQTVEQVAARCKVTGVKVGPGNRYRNFIDKPHKPLSF